MLPQGAPMGTFGTLSCATHEDPEEVEAFTATVRRDAAVCPPLADATVVATAVSKRSRMNIRRRPQEHPCAALPLPKAPRRAPAPTAPGWRARGP